MSVAEATGQVAEQLAIGTLDAAAQPAFQALFAEVFGNPLSPAMRQWKYGDGHGLSIGAWQEQRLVAHCGIFYRDVLVGGVARRIGQLGDLMAAADKAGGLARRNSPFFRLIRAVLAQLAGPDNPDSLAFGFPSERAMRLGERLGVFASIDQMVELQFPAQPASWLADRRRQLLAADADFMRLADGLWAAMAADLGDAMVGVRDGAYLSRRYFAHPEHQYRLVEVRPFLSAKPLGLIVLRALGGGWELSDLLGPLEHLPRLLRAAQAEVAALGGHGFALWLTEAYARRYAHLASSCQPLEFRIMANPLGSAELRQRFDRRWWLTSGDTDYR